MDIREFLAKVDENEAALATGASVNTVRKWRQGARIPSRKKALRLIDWSHGVLTLDGIYLTPKVEAEA